jgi:hypothetical protein
MLVTGALGSLMPVVFHSGIGAKCSGDPYDETHDALYSLLSLYGSAVAAAAMKEKKSSHAASSSAAPGPCAAPWQVQCLVLSA